jgi:hypothetical protein
VSHRQVAAVAATTIIANSGRIVQCWKKLKCNVMVLTVRGKAGALGLHFGIETLIRICLAVPEVVRHKKLRSLRKASRLVQPKPKPQEHHPNCCFHSLFVKTRTIKH